MYWFDVSLDLVFANAYENVLWLVTVAWYWTDCGTVRQLTACPVNDADAPTNPAGVSATDGDRGSPSGAVGGPMVTTSTAVSCEESQADPKISTMPCCGGLLLLRSTAFARKMRPPTIGRYVVFDVTSDSGGKGGALIGKVATSVTLVMLLPATII